MSESEPIFDAIVVGTGFAGAVTACRLTQAGRRICVLERGRRYGPDDLPVYPEPRETPDPTGPRPDYVQPDVARAFWSLGQGLWDVRDLGDVIAAQAAGYGGGSLIYANVHLRAPPEVFEHGWPGEYRRDALDPYYDLAAYMLGARKMPEHLRPPKRVQLERAAEKLGAGRGEARVFHFDPPLAVSFPDGPPGREPPGEWRTNAWGRRQGNCDLRGDCCFGCGKQAKNTLDLNYLAIAEDAEMRSRPAPDIRTLAEVVSIECLSVDDSLVYRVEYEDHLFGGRRERVHGEAVFLCAGCVNTTELLLRCCQTGKLTIPGDALGAGYFPNVDTLAAVFDGAELQEADRGPTITGSLLYTRDCEDPERRDRGDAPARDWLLIQDGGMPTALEPLLGAFRSPLWVRRNRYREGAISRNSKAGTQAYAELPFETLLSVLSGLTRSAGRRGLSTSLSIGEQMRRGPAGEEHAEDDREGLLPEQLQEAWKRDREDLLELCVAAGEPLVEAFLVHAAAKLESRYDKLYEQLQERLPIADLEVGDMEDLHLGQRALRLALQLVWGSEAGMVEDLVHVLEHRLMPEGDALLDRATGLLRWALDYRQPDGHTALLLSMGRDSHAGDLKLAPDAPAAGGALEGSDTGSARLLGEPLLTRGSWGDPRAQGMLLLADVTRPFKVGEELAVEGRVIGTATSEATELVLVEGEPGASGVWALRFETTVKQRSTAPLRARLPGPLDATERIVQERLLRDLAADAWDGELRTDPAWNILGRRVTVHSQGGCPMAAVTEPDGRVVGCEGLYVMDAAAFPTAVGVNPSATIAAIAEYKIERYIRTLEGMGDWRADEFAAAQRWADEQIGTADDTGPRRTRRDDLDPIAEIERRLVGRPSAPPRHEPVGIRFKEHMEGFHAPSGSDPDEDLEPYRRAERAGIDAAARIVTDLDAEIADLALFLERHRAACESGPRKGRFPRMEVTGSVELHFGPEVKREAVKPGSSMQLRDPAPGEAVEQRILTYDLLLQLDGRPHRLRGNKYIRDDRGADVWEDATTLFFDVEEGEGECTPVLRGILRQSTADFLDVQLRSFEATNTPDPARQTWALAAFGRYFFGNLIDVYLPPTDRFAEFLRGVVGRTHV